MAELIQFQCPACGVTLRLPLALAASQGPCPCCNRQIVAPDPHGGEGAYEPEPPPVFQGPAASRPFAEPPLPLEKAPPTKAPSRAVFSAAAPAPAAPVPTPPTSQRAVFVLALLLTAFVSLVTGYLLGMRSDWIVAKTPFPQMGPFHPEPQASSEPPASDPLLVKPLVRPPAADPIPPATDKTATESVGETQPEPAKASAAAASALKAFLDAPDWTTRSAHVLFPEKTAAAMEAYSRQAPDGPTSYQAITVQNSYTDKKTGYTLFIFQVTTETHPTGIPVAVAETHTGWQVDWHSFVEFRDDRFKAFADGPAGQTGRFHLIVSAPPPQRTAKTDNEHFASFLLDPPLPGRQRIAYVKKSSEAYAQLSQATASGTIFTPVLEVAKHTTPDGKPYLEIVGIQATDWLPRDS